MNNNNITGIVFAGGKSSRMGQNKALMPYKERRYIDNAIRIIQPFVGSILISSNEPIPNIHYPLVPDEIKNIGPIGGLYSCLKKSETDVNIIIPCDVPLLSDELYEQICQNITGFDAVVPEINNNKLEPLVAAYRKSLLPEIEKAIHANDFKLINLFKNVEVRYLKVHKTEQFKNVNTPEDLL